MDLLCTPPFHLCTHVNLVHPRACYEIAQVFHQNIDNNVVRPSGLDGKVNIVLREAQSPPFGNRQYHGQMTSL